MYNPYAISLAFRYYSINAVICYWCQAAATKQTGSKKISHTNRAITINRSNTPVRLPLREVEYINRAQSTIISNTVRTV